MFDFCKEFDFLKMEEVEKGLKLSPIARQSSKPNHGDDSYYNPTQLMSNYIKELGFGGIRYSSSLKKDGKNILIFDDFNVEYEDDATNATLQILNSSVYKIAEIKILFDKYLPIRL